MSDGLRQVSPKFENAFKELASRLKLNLCKHGLVRGAQDLARILVQIYGTWNLGWVSQGRYDLPYELKGNNRSGIICYMNIPNFNGQGHIDLWDGFAQDLVGNTGRKYWNSETIWIWTFTGKPIPSQTFKR